ncbi:MAG: hypothetical protein A2571_00630 [Candidatus Vogelbacteria bacterium RIFOXYD1_FULL_44_32]|uniref:LysM domain-containing protein n=1 Tax=Candidatus Vogelbacteria bacterium RIFOXYD1_FULL_44_32 TaxID=1802438 RepID=A0A1G2QEM4_9BACT|nr:MAG: hypothetical protein A2571_00630 [Candidatus Vogelbacteria bacterium RIFOXYD1_FULL_44_32]
MVLVYRTAYAGFFGFGSSQNPSLVALQSATVLNSQKMALLEPVHSPSPFFGRGGPLLVEDGSALVPNVGPAGTAGATIFIPKNDQISTYTVKSGDTLSEIADMYGVSVNTIMWANNIKKTSAIAEGDVLVILPISGVRHMVKSGDTIAKIAKLYGADAEEIGSYNGLEQNASLKIGEEIIVPHGELPLLKKNPTTPGKKDGSSPSTANKYATLPTYAGYFIRPMVGGLKTQGIHGNNGVDLANTTGAELYAAAAGTVIVARTGGWNGGYGNYVVISHDNGTQTLYGHMLDVAVAPGQVVVQGQTIGRLGSSGNSTGPHIHFEIRGARNPF